MLTTAYPAGVPKEDYDALISVLADHMSEGGLGDVFELCGYAHPAVAANDYARVLSRNPPSIDARKRVANILLSAGFNDWVSEETQAAATLV